MIHPLRIRRNDLPAVAAGSAISVGCAVIFWVAAHHGTPVVPYGGGIANQSGSNPAVTGPATPGRSQHSRIPPSFSGGGGYRTVANPEPYTPSPQPEPSPRQPTPTPAPTRTSSPPVTSTPAPTTTPIVSISACVRVVVSVCVPSLEVNP